MALYYPSMLQTYLPLGASHESETPHITMFPPVQVHSYYSGPLAVIRDYNNGYNDSSVSQVEYHHIYGANPYFYPYPFWHFPQVSPLPLYSPYPNNHPYGAYQRQDNIWPEGFTLRGELHWGRLEKIAGPRRNLPEFVKEDLRRVYGTYPRTDVSITFHNGEFLVRGDPRVGEQEYKIEKKIIRKEPTTSASEAEDSSENQSKKKKKKKSRR